MHDSRTELASKSETELKKILLVEEICAQQRTASRLSRINAIGTLLASAGALVAALVALTIAQSDSAKQIVEAHETEADYFKTKEELSQLRSQVHQKDQELRSKQTNLDALRQKEEVLLRQIRALENATTAKPRASVTGLSIDIEQTDNQLFLNVASYPRQAIVTAYEVCRSDFVFPDHTPPIEQFSPPPGDYRDQPTPCKLGPFLRQGNLRNDIWVVADFGSHKEFRFVHLGRT